MLHFLESCVLLVTVIMMTHWIPRQLNFPSNPATHWLSINWSTCKLGDTLEIISTELRVNIVKC